ncbi:hypothetical protein [Acinetobacter sp. ANC 3791]|uniref:hypothetical protein n=1 Tax=Acinetobacter sp. ANC 3791 TaxID=2529836 RepID=UPI00103A85C0|nr:hypothetical protein [Acinetobacter sp. ANC 3791]TCB86252.1 hypothetical protein E0H90_00010 [Acinetobacter sp. ANC 3791]
MSTVACQKAESDSTKTATPKTTTETHATASKPVDLATKCQSLDKQLKQFNQQGIIPKQLIAFNTELKQCVAHVPLKQRYEWFNATSNLYEKFIGQYESQELDEYIGHIEYETSLDSTYESAVERKEIREQSLAKHKKTWAKLTDQQHFIINNLKVLYLDIYNLGEGEFTLTQHPRYDVEIFAPHLLKADQVYLKQNSSEYYGANLDLDAGLSLSFKELAKRLLFWEKYQIQFPNSHFHKQVVNNIKDYRRLLLLGLENTPVITTYDKSELADPKAIQAITQVSQTNSTSSPIAQQVLDLIKQETETWHQLHAVENSTEEDLAAQAHEFGIQVNKKIYALVEQADNSTK